MSAVVAVPELMAAAGTDLESIRSSLDAAHLVAAVPTQALLPAAADEVSGNIAHLFSQHAEDYQVAAGEAATFHEQFAEKLTAAAASYAGSEAANAASLIDSAAPAASTAFPTLDEISFGYNFALAFMATAFPFLYEISRPMLWPIVTIPFFAAVALPMGLLALLYILYVFVYL